MLSWFQTTLKGGQMCMKRLMLFLLMLTMLLLTGCSESKPTIAPAKLTKDEQALLRMFDQQYPGQVYDFTAPEGAVGLIIRRQHLENGQWVAASHYLHVTEETGRIAIRFDNLADGLHCAILQSGEVEATSAFRKPGTETTAMMTATATLDKTVSAELSKEIPLLMQVFTSTNGMGVSIPGLDDYPDPSAFAGYDDVCIVTAEFTDKPLE